jgi:membrane fusion protein (multidrug efflux system)
MDTTFDDAQRGEAPPTAREKDDLPRIPIKDRIAKSVHEHPVRAAIVGAVTFVAVVGAFLYWLHSRRFENTDDAQIDADMSAVSPRVAGTVIAVHVIDNQRVDAGDLIAEIDTRDLDVALTQARAALMQAEAELAAEKPSVPITEIGMSKEDVASVATELVAAERELERDKAQIAQAEAADHYASANVDALVQAALAAQRKVEQQRARLAAARERAAQAKLTAPEQLAAREASMKLHAAAVEVARARLEKAMLERSYTRVVAPVAGIIGKKSVNVGDYVQPGQSIAALTQTDHVWVTANFRETQLEKMRPGQRTKVHVDAIDRDFDGEVESMPGATGSKYSLLPPENATGNYVKVVQRLPVRIKLYENQADHERLRPGMSVEPKVALR